MSKAKNGLKQLGQLFALNYALIFDKCFTCKKNKDGRMLFCSIKCAIKTVREG